MSHLHQILCLLLNAAARSFSGSVAIRYVHPVLWRRRHICTQWAICGIPIDSAAMSDVIVSSYAGYSAAAGYAVL